MGDDYPRLLVDGDVTVSRGGQLEQTRLRGWLDRHDGPMPTYRIELVTRFGNYTCPYTATGPDAFEALVRLRRQLEPDGLMVAVQGSRRDTYPSGMARDMGGGMRVYILRPGVPGRPDLVRIFDDAQADPFSSTGDIYRLRGKNAPDSTRFVPPNSVYLDPRHPYGRRAGAPFARFAVFAGRR